MAEERSIGDRMSEAMYQDKVLTRLGEIIALLSKIQQSLEAQSQAPPDAPGGTRQQEDEPEGEPAAIVKVTFTGDRADKDQVVIVKVNGELHTDSLGFFEDKLTTLIADGYYNLRLDFSRVTHVSSVGFGLIAATYKHVFKHDGELKIVNASQKISNTTEMLDMGYLLEK